MGSSESQEANTGHLLTCGGKVGGVGARTPHVRRSQPKLPHLLCNPRRPQASPCNNDHTPQTEARGSPHCWHPQHSTDPAVVVNAHEGQGGPGELHGLEVDGGACGPGTLESRLIYGAWGGGAVEDGHGLQREPVHDVDTAVVEGQGQPWGHMQVKRPSPALDNGKWLHRAQLVSDLIAFQAPWISRAVSSPPLGLT